jgi:hypothetical protein
VDRRRNEHSGDARKHDQDQRERRTNARFSGLANR